MGRLEVPGDLLRATGSIDGPVLLAQPGGTAVGWRRHGPGNLSSRRPPTPRQRCRWPTRGSPVRHGGKASLATASWVGCPRTSVPMVVIMAATGPSGRKTKRHHPGEEDRRAAASLSRPSLANLRALPGPERTFSGLRGGPTPTARSDRPPLFAQDDVQPLRNCAVPSNAVESADLLARALFENPTDPGRLGKAESVPSCRRDGLDQRGGPCRCRAGAPRRAGSSQGGVGADLSGNRWLLSRSRWMVQARSASRLCPESGAGICREVPRVCISH